MSLSALGSRSLRQPAALWSSPPEAPSSSGMLPANHKQLSMKSKQNGEPDSEQQEGVLPQPFSRPPKLAGISQHNRPFLRFGGSVSTSRNSSASWPTMPHLFRNLSPLAVVLAQTLLVNVATNVGQTARLSRPAGFAVSRISWVMSAVRPC